MSREKKQRTDITEVDAEVADQFKLKDKFKGAIMKWMDELDFNKKIHSNSPDTHHIRVVPDTTVLFSYIIREVLNMPLELNKSPIVTNFTLTSYCLMLYYAKILIEDIS